MKPAVRQSVPDRGKPPASSQVVPMRGWWLVLCARTDRLRLSLSMRRGSVLDVRTGAARDRDRTRPVATALPGAPRVRTTRTSSMRWCRGDGPQDGSDRARRADPTFPTRCDRACQTIGPTLLVYSEGGANAPWRGKSLGSLSVAHAFDAVCRRARPPDHRTSPSTRRSTIVRRRAPAPRLRSGRVQPALGPRSRRNRRPQAYLAARSGADRALPFARHRWHGGRSSG